MCDGSTAKKLLFVFNVVFLAGGLALLGFGLWMKFDPNIVHFLNIVNVSHATPLLHYAAIIFIIAGGAVILVGVLGFLAVLRNSQSWLFIYAVLVLVVMVAEIVGGALALTYRTKMEGNLVAAMVYQVKLEYYPGNDAYESWNHLQEKMSCCGATNYTDYEGSKWWNNTDTRNATTYVPESCCKSDDVTQCQLDAKNRDANSDYLFTEGCAGSVTSWFEMHTLVMMILGFAIGGCQIFAFLTACCLRNALKANPNKYT